MQVNCLLQPQESLALFSHYLKSSKIQWDMTINLDLLTAKQYSKTITVSNKYMLGFLLRAEWPLPMHVCQPMHRANPQKLQQSPRKHLI